MNSMIGNLQFDPIKVNTFAESVFCENSLSVVDGKKSEVSPTACLSWGLGGSQGTRQRAATLPLLDSKTPSRCSASEINGVAPSLKFKMPCEKRSENSRWSRTTLGMMMPGVSWFLTLTTSPQSSSPVRKDYDKFWRWWWRKQCPGVQCLWVETTEGLGVIHAVLRFPVGFSSVPTQETVQQEWQRGHQAFSTWSRAGNSRKLANYMRQKEKERVAGEIRKQRGVVAWDYSRGWLPPGFLKVWGRAWTETICRIPRVEQSRVIADWLAAVVVNPENLDIPPVYENNLIMEYYVD